MDFFNFYIHSPNSLEYVYCLEGAHVVHGPAVPPPGVLKLLAELELGAPRHDVCMNGKKPTIFLNINWRSQLHL